MMRLGKPVAQDNLLVIKLISANADVVCGKIGAMY